MHKAQDVLLRVADVIAVMGISRSTWQKLVRTGQTPPIVRIGKVHRVRRGALTEWLEKKESCAAPSTLVKQS